MAQTQTPFYQGYPAQGLQTLSGNAPYNSFGASPAAYGNAARIYPGFNQGFVQDVPVLGVGQVAQSQQTGLQQERSLAAQIMTKLNFFRQAFPVLYGALTQALDINLRVPGLVNALRAQGALNIGTQHLVDVAKAQGQLLVGCQGLIDVIRGQAAAITFAQDTIEKLRLTLNILQMPGEALEHAIDTCLSHAHKLNANGFQRLSQFYLAATEPYWQGAVARGELPPRQAQSQQQAIAPFIPQQSPQQPAYQQRYNQLANYYNPQQAFGQQRIMTNSAQAPTPNLPAFARGNQAQMQQQQMGLAERYQQLLRAAGGNPQRAIGALGQQQRGFAGAMG